MFAMIDSIFGSKTRVKLLRLFLNNPERAFYVREITRQVGEQINSVRRELKNLLELGIIVSDESENRLYYSANTSFQLFRPMSEIFANSEAVASDEKVAISEWRKKFTSIDNVVGVAFAGKLVYGSDSDIDILIISDGASSIKIKNAIKLLEKENGGSLSYTVLNLGDFYYRTSVRDKFLMDFLANKHVVVVDRKELFAKNSQELIDKEEK